jgi:hypothetical protein
MSPTYADVLFDIHYLADDVALRAVGRRGRLTFRGAVSSDW